MSGFHTLSRDEARVLLHARGQRHSGVHAMTKKIFHWPYCANCGILALKNDVTRRALRAACIWEE